MNPWVYVGIHPYHRTIAVQRLKASNTSLKGLLETVAFVFDVTEEQLLSTSRKHRIVLARHAFCKVARNLSYNYSQIAGFLSKNHATIINSVKQADALVETYSVFSEPFHKLEDVIIEANIKEESKKLREKHERILLQPG